MDFWSTVLDFADHTTTEVGRSLLESFGTASATEKADGSLVTQCDRWADGALRDAIAQTFPDHGILSEEAKHVFPDKEWCWIIDPIDGTTNFARGVPLWGISLGLLYQGTPVFGYVYLPPIAQSFHGFWYGESGLSGPTGAFLNDRPIHTSPDDPSGNHFMNLCARSTAILQSPVPCKIRMLGVATYNILTVANGVALASVEATPKIWDIAAVWAIAQAAGAKWIPLDGANLFPLTVGQDYRSKPYPTLVVSRPELSDRFYPLTAVLRD
jgi:myo-inositol-1(or 4)-monophosphatase